MPTKKFRPITPGFLIEPMVPLYVAWFFFMFRFYVLPPLLGYGVMGMLSFVVVGVAPRTIGRHHVVEGSGRGLHLALGHVDLRSEDLDHLVGALLADDL